MPPTNLHTGNASSPSSLATATPTPSPQQKIPQAGRKRRASGTGSRGVANLTPEQLAKKRANDREAQRAIRERTKNQIEMLEKRIEELTSQQPYQELQNVTRQKEAVEAENAEIKRRLASVLNLIQPLLSGHDAGGILSPNVRDDGSQYSRIGSQGSINHTNVPATGSYPATSSMNSFASPSMQPRPFHGQWSMSPAHTAATSEAMQSRASPSIQGRHSGSDMGQPSLMRTTSAERLALGLMNVGQPEMQSKPHLLDQPKPCPALPADSHITLSSKSRSPDGSSGSSGHGNSHNGMHHQLPRPAFNQVPPHVPATCPLDQLLLEFLAERSQRAAEGVSEAELIGPAYPSFEALMAPERREVAVHPISRVLADIIATFPDIATPPEKAAVYYIMTLVMRWQVAPTRANHERLPAWMRPSGWQAARPHAVWVDHVPWPAMRDELVGNYERYPLELFFVPYTTTLSLNWPYDDVDIFAPPKPSDGELALSPAFESHLRNLNNWSLGSAFTSQFPMLASGVRIEDKEREARR